jgi:hypothetical protein
MCSFVLPVQIGQPCRAQLRFGSVWVGLVACSMRAFAKSFTGRKAVEWLLRSNNAADDTQAVQVSLAPLGAVRRT